MMAEFKTERSVVIQAPVAAVYDYVSDFTRHAEWNYQPGELTRLTEGPAGAGTRYRTKEQPVREMSWLMRRLFPLIGKMIGAEDHTVAEITALEPNRRVAWKAELPLKKGGVGAATDWEIRLEPQGEGTRVTQWVYFRFYGALGKRVDPQTAERQAGDEMAANLAELKTLLETQPGPGTATSQPALA
jgi:uncharacterized protein YndB with AHSA1/START domain